MPITIAILVLLVLILLFVAYLMFDDEYPNYFDGKQPNTRICKTCQQLQHHHSYVNGDGVTYMWVPTGPVLDGKCHCHEDCYKPMIREFP